MNTDRLKCKYCDKEMVKCGTGMLGEIRYQRYKCKDCNKTALGEVVESDYKSIREPWNKGLRGVQRHSQKTRDKMSAIRVGTKHTKEWNANIGKGNKGKVRTEEIKKQWSEAHTGKILTEEHVGHMKEGLRKRWSDPKYKKRMSKTHKRDWENPEYREKHRKALIETWKRPGYKERFLKTMAKKWANPEFKNKRLQEMYSGMNVSPNKFETIIFEILNKLYPHEWDFTGDGKVTFNNLKPDFTNVNGQKKIIECFGTYWHSEEIIRYEHQGEEGRKQVYAEFGYSTLVIWENELNDMEAVVEKIRAFAE